MMKRVTVALLLALILARPVWAQRVDGSGVRVNGVTQQSIAATYVGNAFCLNLTTSDTYIARVGTNDIGFYTGATRCGVGGTLRLDVSATAVTSAVNVVLGSANSLNWGDVFQYRPAPKTLRFDTDGAGGALTLVDVKGPLQSASYAPFGLSSGFDSSGNVKAEGAAALFWVGRTIMRAPTDGTFQIGPNAGTTGARWNYATDGMGQLLAFGGADTAILKANGVNATGSVGIAATPGSAGSLSWPGTTPGSPVNGDTWIDTNAGNWTTAATTISLKARNNGVTRTIGSVTF